MTSLADVMETLKNMMDLGTSLDEIKDSFFDDIDTQEYFGYNNKREMEKDKAKFQSLFRLFD